jgi:hypothetical protein
MKKRTIYKTLLDSFDKCDRYGYLKYFYNGTGVELASARSVEMSRGSAIHSGVDCLWRGKTAHEAIATAKNLYLFESKDSLNLLPASTREEVNEELCDSIEGAIWLWYIVRLPALLQENEYIGSEYKIITDLTDELSLLAKPDAIIKARATGRFLNWSLKTEKSHQAFSKHASALIDTGGLTECISAAMTVGDGDLRNIAGTLMEYLVVGELDKEEPIVWHPCVRGWRREKPWPTGLAVENHNDYVDPETLPKVYEYAWRWKFDNPSYDPDGPKSSQKNPKTKSLSAADGWSRFRARDYPGGIEMWVRNLLAQKFVPKLDPLPELCYYPVPYERKGSEVESFLVQAVQTQTQVNRNLEALQDGRLSIDQAFPQRRGNCLRYGKDYRCEMWAICFEGGLADPNAFGYVQRKSSTDREIERLQWEASNQKEE